MFLTFCNISIYIYDIITTTIIEKPSLNICLMAVALKTLDESEVIKRLLLICFEFCAKIVRHLVSTTWVLAMDMKNGKSSFMDPFLIVRKYSFVEYIMNAYRLKWVSYFKNICVCYHNIALLP